MVKKGIKKNFSIKQKNLGVLLILVVVGIMLFRIIILSPPPLTGHFTKEGITYLCINCTDCTAAIADASSGNTINLTADVSNVDGTCIDFGGKDDVTLDCQEYFIEGDDDSTGNGIYLPDTSGGSNNNTIKNCNVTKFKYGIYVFTSSNNTLANITSSFNTNRGIYLGSSSNNSLINIIANSNVDGIYLYSSSSNTFRNITANSNSFNGFDVRVSENNTFTNIIANSSGIAGIRIEEASNNNVLINISTNDNSKGIYLDDSSNNTLTNITSNLNTQGIYFDGASNNVITDVISNDNTQYGIYLYVSSNNNVLTNVSLNSNSNEGIYLFGASNNILTNITSNSNKYGIHDSNGINNTFTNIITNLNSFDGFKLGSGNNHILTNVTSNNNSQYGIYLYSSSNNTFTNITSNNNFEYGIWIAGSNNTLTNITANSNTQVGIWLSSGSNNILTNIISQENIQEDIYVNPTSPPCQNNFTNITGSGNRAIEFYNSATTVENKELAGLILCNAHNTNVTNVTIRGSDSFKNNAMFVLHTNNTQISNINSSENFFGIYLISSYNNTLTNITANSNSYFGLYLSSSSNNTLINITTNSNTNDGIKLWASSNNNTISNSHIEDNTQYGMYFQHSGSNYPQYNLIYNNLFNNTNNYKNTTALTNFFNTTNTSGTNIINGSWIGGNYWGYPNGTGFSDICADADSDGICDSSYSLDGVNYDYLPLAGGGCTESWTCTDWSTCVSSLQTRTCTDSNACGTTATKPAVSQACTVTPASGGSAPPGVVADQPTTTATWDVVEPEAPLEMDITNLEIGITDITVEVSETVTSVSIKVTEIDVVPLADLKIDLGGDTYQSFKIDVTGINDTNIESVVIDFKVNKTWLDESGTIEDIILYRKQDTGNKWDELVTTFVSSDDDFYYFSSTSSGFSSFTIALKIARMIECIPEEKKCIGNVLQQCSANGMTWETIETCDYKCKRNKCVTKFEFPVLIFYMITVVLSVGILIVVFVGYRYFSKSKLKKQAEKRTGTFQDETEESWEKSNK